MILKTQYNFVYSLPRRSEERKEKLKNIKNLFQRQEWVFVVFVLFVFLS